MLVVEVFLFKFGSVCFFDLGMNGKRTREVEEHIATGWTKVAFKWKPWTGTDVFSTLCSSKNQAHLGGSFFEIFFYILLMIQKSYLHQLRLVVNIP